MEAISLQNAEQLSIFSSLGTGTVLQALVTPDSATLIVNSGRTIDFYDVATLALVRSIPLPARLIALSPDGATLALSLLDNTIQLWDVANFSHRATIEEFDYVPMTLAFSADSTVMVVSSYFGFELWDITTLSKVEVPGEQPQWQHVLATASLDEERIVTLVGENFSVTSIKDGTHSRFKATGYGDVLAVSPDGTQLAHGLSNGYVAIWEATEWRHVDSLSNLDGSITALAFSSDGRLLAAGTAKGAINIWDIAEGNLVKALERHTGAIRSLTFVQNDGTLVSGSIDGKVINWDVKSGVERQSVAHYGTPITKLAFSPDGALLAAGGANGAIQVWSMVDETVKWSASGHKDRITGLDFSTDGKLLVSSSPDKSATLKLWDVETGSELDASTYGNRLFVSGVAFWPGRHGVLVNISAAISLSPDGLPPPTYNSSGLRPMREDLAFIDFVVAKNQDTVIASGSRYITFWSIATKERTGTILEAAGTSFFELGVSPDENLIAASSGYYPDGLATEFAIWIWDVSNDNSLLHHLPSTDISLGPVRDLLFSADNQVLFTIDRRLVSWNVSDGTRIATHTVFEPQSMALSPDGYVLAIAGDAGTIELWAVPGR